MSRFLVILLFSIVAASFYGETLGQGTLGGWHPIAPNDPEVQRAAVFAVQEQNRRTGGSLVLVQILSAEYQVVAGTNYRVQISARQGGVSRNFQAVVFRSLQNTHQLTSFDPK